MRLLILIFSLWALAYAKPEMYKEKEDFQYSRSSSDEGSKAGYYGAQRGNMGGNYERAHNMDSLAQHQMSNLVRQVDVELGEGANTRTGSVFTSGNSRGIYGSGNYDLSNLKGRSFEEGVSYGDSQLQSSFLSQNTGYSGNSYSAANNARYTTNQLRSLGLASQYDQISNQQAGGQYSGASNYEYGNQGASNYRYYTHGGSQAHSVYDQGNPTLYSVGNNDDSTKSKIITTPVRIYLRPGTRIAIPVSAQTYDASQSALINNQNTVNTEAELLRNGGQRVNVIKPTSNAKHYESSYRYHKEWEKHDTQPYIVPTENPFPQNSELYEDSQLSQSIGKQFKSELDATNTQTSNINSAYESKVNAGYNSAYSANTKSAAASRLQYQSQLRNSGSNVASNAHIVDSQNSGSSTNLNNIVEDINTRPKSYQSSYSYHKSWERHGDPYVIKPVGGDLNALPSQRLVVPPADQNLYYGNQYGQACDLQCHLRKKRSYHVQEYHPQSLNDWLSDLGQQQNEHQTFDYLGQEIKNKWDNLENLGQETQNQWSNMDLGQQTQNKWNNLDSLNQQSEGAVEDLSQQSQSQLDHLENLGQETQNTWNNLETLNQKPQSDIENLGQETQNTWNDLETLNQKPQSDIENLGQETQNIWNNLEPLNQKPQSDNEKLGQETQNTWNDLETLNQKPNNDIENLGQETQKTWNNLETLNHKPKSDIENLGQETQNIWNNLETLNQKPQSDIKNLGQETQNTWNDLETLNQKPQSDIENLGQKTQNIWNNLEALNLKPQSDIENLGQETQNTWNDLETLNQKPQSDIENLGQETQNTWNDLETLNQKPQSDIENLGQKTQNIWNNLETLNQKPQSDIENLGQETQNTWNDLETLNQKPQSDIENLGQETQNIWNNLGTLNQKPQSDIENLGQKTQNIWNNLETLNQKPQSDIENLGQETQNTWNDLETLNQKPQSDIENLGQETQNIWNNLETLNQKPQSDNEKLGQETQNTLNDLETLNQKPNNDIVNLGQETQNTWNDLETLNQKPNNDIENLGQETQNIWNNLETLNQKPQSDNENLGQETQNIWQNLDILNQHPQSVIIDVDQQSQSQLDNIENIGQKRQQKNDKFDGKNQQTFNIWNTIENQQSRNKDEQTQNQKVEHFGGQNESKNKLDLQNLSQQPGYNVWNQIDNFESKHNLESYNRNSNHQQFYSSHKENTDTWDDMFQHDNQNQRTNEGKPTSITEKNLWDIVDKVISESEKETAINHKKYVTYQDWEEQHSAHTNYYHNSHNFYQHHSFQSKQTSTEKTIVPPTDKNLGIEVIYPINVTPITKEIKTTEKPTTTLSNVESKSPTEIGRGDIGADELTLITEANDQNNNWKAKDSQNNLNPNKLYKTQDEIESLSLTHVNEDQSNIKLNQEETDASVTDLEQQFESINTGLEQQFESINTPIRKPKDNYNSHNNLNDQTGPKQYRVPSYNKPLTIEREPSYEDLQKSDIQIPNDLEQQNLNPKWFELQQQFSHTEDIKDFGQQKQEPISINMQQQYNDFYKHLENGHEKIQNHDFIDYHNKHSLNEDKTDNGNNLQSVPKKEHMVEQPIEPTEKPGFWKSFWNKTVSAKAAVVSWFKN